MTSRVTSTSESLLLVRLSFFSFVFGSPVLKPNFHLKQRLFIMIKIFIELINNFLSDGIYLSGLKEEVLRLVRAEHNSMLA